MLFYVACNLRVLLVLLGVGGTLYAATCVLLLSSVVVQPFEVVVVVVVVGRAALAVVK